jgi:hypothetical protein
MPSDAELAEMFRRSVVLRPAGRISSSSPVRVRSLTSPDGIPCCFGPCWEKGDDRYRVEVPHETPRWPGEQLIYIYCSPKHRTYHVDSIRGRRGIDER